MTCGSSDSRPGEMQGVKRAGPLPLEHPLQLLHGEEGHMKRFTLLAGLVVVLSGCGAGVHDGRR